MRWDFFSSFSNTALKLTHLSLAAGAWSRYLVEVKSLKFKGMSTIAQHRLVSNVLKDEIAAMHAIRIFTSAE